ncbi:YrhB domain-containing protein [Amycolatopsis samaneae]|uniref:YrhB domain-containing protein n=1 Tax=Amycolatopsis samaneae TaxID=664691 RepID=A0ABW5GJU9_9PSEU
MNAEEAVARLEDWLRNTPDGDRTTGPAALRVRPEYTVHRAGGWNFTLNAAAYLDGTDPGKGLFPSPVVFVPDDGGEITYDLAMMAQSTGDTAETGFTEWQADVDPEFDAAAFPALLIPKRAVRGWARHTLYDQPTGEYRANDEYRAGPLWTGYPAPATDVEKLVGYLNVDWLSRAEFTAALLDRDVFVPLKDGEPIFRPLRDAPSGDTRELIAFSASAKVPAAYPERLVGQPRQILNRWRTYAMTLDPGGPTPISLTSRELYLVRDPVPTGVEEREPVTAFAPEASPEVLDALPAITAEFGLTPSDLLSRHLAYVAKSARENGYELSAAECLEYLRAFALRYRNAANLRNGQAQNWPDDLAAEGLITHFADDGSPRPVPWTFGKFLAAGTPSDAFAWHRVLGAYVGFAIGDALGSGADPAGPLPLGGLTRQLLCHTESVLRGLPSITETGEVPATLPAGGRPDGWIARATAHAGPPPSDFSGLFATALAATLAGGVELSTVDGERYAKAVARELTGTAAGPEISAGVDLLVTVFRALLTKDAFALPVHILLKHLLSGDDLAKSVLALREDRAADDVAQFEGIGDGRQPQSVLGRALFAAAKRGHDPAAALELAAGGGPVCAALTGALVGARVGVPGLPFVSSLTDLGLLDNAASDVFRHFNRFGVAREPAEREQWLLRYPLGEN